MIFHVLNASLLNQGWVEVMWNEFNEIIASEEVENIRRRNFHKPRVYMLRVVRSDIDEHFRVRVEFNQAEAYEVITQTWSGISMYVPNTPIRVPSLWNAPKLTSRRAKKKMFLWKAFMHLRNDFSYRLQT